MRTILAAVAAVLVGGAGLAAAQDEPPAEAPKPDLVAELRTLRAEYDAAWKKFWEPWEKAKTDAEREKLVYEPGKLPYHAFMPRFRELAARAKGTDAALGALLWLVSTDTPAAPDAAMLRGAIDTILADHIGSDLLGPFPLEVAGLAGTIGEAKAEAAIRKLRDGSPHKATKGDAGYALGRLLAESTEGTPERVAKRKAEGIALLRAVLAEFPKAAWVPQATGYLFEIERLQVGMVAPDFESTDQEGKAWKLSDYRGKVVVVDFWGYW